jgi:maltose-binding protein MalE
MRIVRRAFLAITALALTTGLAAAQTTVRWLHIEANPVQVKIWEEVARDFESKNPGVKVEMQYLENEAYKAKAPTLLQSRDRPHIIYSWAGGVLKAQVEAGVLEDITAQVQDHKDKLSASAVAAFTVDGKIYGLPHTVSQVGFMANKELLGKGRRGRGAIKTWDDLLDAVKKLKSCRESRRSRWAAPTNGRCISTGRISPAASVASPPSRPRSRARTAASRPKPFRKPANSLSSSSISSRSRTASSASRASRQSAISATERRR